MESFNCVVGVCVPHHEVLWHVVTDSILCRQPQVACGNAQLTAGTWQTLDVQSLPQFPGRLCGVQVPSLFICKYHG